MQRHCMDCGQPTRRVSTALRCFACAKSRPRIADPRRRRGGQFRPVVEGAHVVCMDCRAPMRLAATERRGTLRCEPCLNQRHLARKAVQSKAACAVSKAVRAGELPRPSELLCMDCGRPASQYDHRDYTKPLHVQPVCRSCNVMRGPADVWPDVPAEAAA